MVLKGMGQVRSFRVSSKLIFWLLLFLGLYVGASVLAINQYFIELRAQKTQAALMMQLQKDIGETRKELFRSRQQLAMLQDHILKNSPEGMEASESNTVSSIRREEPPSQEKAGDHSGDEGRKSIVGVRELSVRKAGTELAVAFRLVNLVGRNDPLRGYAHLIVTARGSDPPQIWTYPKVALREDAPMDFKSGYLFSIRNYMNIKAQIFLNTETDNPTNIRLLVYDETGELIFNREFDLSEIS